MRKKNGALFLSILIAITSWATEGEYAVANIPANLIKGANAVVRLWEEKVTLKNLEKMNVTQHYVITILNENGSWMSDMSEVYDQFSSIESIDGTLYDAWGKKLKSVKKSDIKDLSIDGESLAVDGRVKAHNFYHKLYPYTIEYTIETVQKQTMFFPQWMSIPGELIAVQKSDMTIDVPADYVLRYKAFNYTREPDISRTDNRKKYHWGITDNAALTREYAGPRWRKMIPYVIMAPSEFQIEDYKGTMNSWKELGLFQTALNKQRDILPDAVKQKVHEIIKNAGSSREKIDLLYKYLQANTRYISIQLGVGGWRPFEASYVAAKGYGDCKALSNFMYSLLKEAGIVSYYTLIKSGDNAEDIISDFPARQFDHVILCVPQGNDTVWLECTSQIAPAGYMGGFTGNRHALLITEDGGKLVETPKYGLKENLEVRRIKAVLDEQGTLRAKVDTRYSAEQQDNIQGLINGLSKDKVKEYLHERLDFPTYEVNDFRYKEEKSALPAVDEFLELTVSNYATITGKRLFILPNIMTRDGRRFDDTEPRKYDIEMGMEYRDIDTVEIQLPKGYQPEAIPRDIKLESKFGRYSYSVSLKDDKIYYYRSMERYGGNFPAKDYPELTQYLEGVYKADRNRIVLVRSETTSALKAF